MNLFVQLRKYFQSVKSKIVRGGIIRTVWLRFRKGLFDFGPILAWSTRVVADKTFGTTVVDAVSAGIALTLLYVSGCFWRGRYNQTGE